MLAAWAVVAWLLLRPDAIALDWNTGRQTDTQSIAINFTKDGGSPMSPRINWRGDGSGLVETELQLYTYAIAAVTKFTGSAEWPGQMLSLLAMALTGLYLFWHLRRMYGQWPAVGGVVGFLGIRTVPFLGTAVMPDATSLCAFMIAWFHLNRYLDQKQVRDLLVYAIAGTLAMLVKPTMAQLGIASFVLICLRGFHGLRDGKLWLAWVAMVCTLSAYLLYAHNLFLTHGNTFGLLFGPESKMPTTEKLLDPRVYWGALQNAARWGLGLPGAAALVVLLLRRRLTPEHWSLLISHAVLVVLALKYMSQEAGNYYFAGLVVTGASCLAALLRDLDRLQRRQLRVALVAAIALVLAIQVPRSAALRHFHINSYRWNADLMTVYETGLALRDIAAPTELVAIRSTSPRINVEWKTPANFHDPRVFYVAAVNGWSFPLDEADSSSFDAFASAGARLFIDPNPERSPVLERWLAERHAQLLWSGTHGGWIWQLTTAATRP